MAAAIDAAGLEAGTECPSELVIALIAASPLVEEAWGMLSAVPRSIRQAAVRSAIAKAFRDGTACPPGATVAGGRVPTAALLALKGVSAVTSDPALVEAAAASLPFFLPCTDTAPGSPDRAVVRMAPVSHVIRSTAERLVCLADPTGSGPASLAARALRQVAARTEQQCIPSAVICAAPALKAMRVTPDQLAAALKDVVLPPETDGDGPVSLGPSKLLAPVHLGDSIDGAEEIGVALLARCDDRGRPLPDPWASSGTAPPCEAASAVREGADSPLAGPLAEAAARVCRALDFHLHPARLRYDVAMCSAISEQRGQLRLEQLAALPRVVQQLEAAGLDEAQRLAVLELAAEACTRLASSRLVPPEVLENALRPEPAGEDRRDEPSPPSDGGVPACPGARTPSLVEQHAPNGSVFVTVPVPQHRRWVLGPSAKRRAPARASAAFSGEGAAGDEAAGVSLATPTVPIGRLVSNVGQDDSSFVDFATMSRTADDGAASAPEADGACGAADEADVEGGLEDTAEELGWEASLELDAFRTALLRGQSSGSGGDPVLRRARGPRVAALAAATEGSTPHQTEADMAAGRFSAMSYNVLADAYVVPDEHPACPALALSWGWRRSLIVAEVLFRRPSILALQEVESWAQPPSKQVRLPAPVDEHSAGGDAAASASASAAAAPQPSADVDGKPKWQKHAGTPASIPRWGGPSDNKHAWFAEALGRHGYECFYARKVKSGGRPMSGHSIGNAIFWRKAEFECTGTHTLSLADEAMGLFAGGEGTWQRGFPQVAAVARLVHRGTGRPVLAAAVHLSSDYTQPQVQALQALALRVGLHRLAAEVRGTTVVACGDFNDSPNGAVSLAMRFARVSAKHAKAAAAGGAGVVPPVYVVRNDIAAAPWKVSAALAPLISASRAAIGAELPFTVASPSFAATLDYIYVQSDSCVAEAALDGLPRAAVSAALTAVSAEPLAPPGPGPVSLPTVEYPSDHLPVAAVLRLCTTSEALAAARAMKDRRGAFRA